MQQRTAGSQTLVRQTHWAFDHSLWLPTRTTGRHISICIRTYVLYYYAIVYWDNAIIIRLREQVKCQREGNQKIGKKSLRGANPLMHPNDNGAAVWQCQDLMDGSPCTSIVAGREH